MIAQKAVGQRFIFTQQAQQQVLRFYIRRTKLAGLVSCKEDNAPCFLCIPLEHKPLTQMLPVTSAGNISLPPRLRTREPSPGRSLSVQPAPPSQRQQMPPDKPTICQNHGRLKT